MLFSRSLSLKSASSSPVIAFVPSVKIPIRLATELAVARLSPVIITVLMPASAQVFMSSITVSLGGSSSPRSPTKVSSLSVFSGFGLAGILSSGRIAIHTILRASEANFSLSSNIFSELQPSQFGITFSGAPFTMANGFSFIIVITVIVFLSESNGITASFGKKPSISFSDIELKVRHAFFMASSVESLRSVEQAVASLSTKAVFSSSGSLVTSVSLSPSYIFARRILLRVSIPVLSEHITSVFPSVSSAAESLTIILLCTMRLSPSAITTVAIAGRLSGIAATASATELTSVLSVILAKFPLEKFCIIPITNVIPQTASIMAFTVFPIPSSSFSSGSTVSPVCCNIAEV